MSAWFNDSGLLGMIRNTVTTQLAIIPPVISYWFQNSLPKKLSWIASQVFPLQNQVVAV